MRQKVWHCPRFDVLWVLGVPGQWTANPAKLRFERHEINVSEPRATAKGAPAGGIHAVPREGEASEASEGIQLLLNPKWTCGRDHAWRRP